MQEQERSPAEVRRRRTVGVFTLVALALITLGLLGVEPPRSRPPEPPRPRVQAGSSAVVIRPGQTAPEGEPAFLAFNPSGSLFVTDRRRKSVLRFDASLRYLGEWGPRLSADVTIDEPAGIVADDVAVWVVDRGATPRLLRISNDGQLAGVIQLAQFGPYGLNGLAQDTASNLYVADTGRNRVLVFAVTGRHLGQFGGGGKELGQFTQPFNLAFGPDGSAFVADWENARIQRWEQTLEPRDMFGLPFRPFGVAVDATGRVFAPDTDRNRVGVYSPRGQPLGELGPLEVVGPTQLAFGPQQNVLWVLGRNGIAGVELTNLEPASAGADAGNTVDLDNLSALATIGVLALGIGAAVWRARRGRAKAHQASEPTR